MRRSFWTTMKLSRAKTPPATKGGARLDGAREFSSAVASSFETLASQAPQDEVFATAALRRNCVHRGDDVLYPLVVRSAATPRVSNHKAVGCAMIRLNLNTL